MNHLTLSRILWRSFFLQAAWNFQGQQNIGLAAAMSAAYEKMYGRGNPAIAEALARTLKPFNTQPYMSGPIIGALVRAEEMGAEGGYPPERLERFKTALMTAFAAIGDAFFWNALLPVTAVLGTLWAVRSEPIGIFIYLFLFNLGHLTCRVWGFFKGYREGSGIVAVIDRLSLPAAALRIRLATSGLLGLLAACVTWGLAPEDWDRGEVFFLGVVVGPVLYFFSFLFKRGLPVEALIYGLLAVFTLGAWARG
ncbi:MAG: PTS system mannose/fructose/sorbose family transporter subunit IID [Pseudomonadota bacterium]